MCICLPQASHLAAGGVKICQKPDSFHEWNSMALQDSRLSQQDNIMTGVAKHRDVDVEAAA